MFVYFLFYDECVVSVKCPDKKGKNDGVHDICIGCCAIKNIDRYIC